MKKRKKKTQPENFIGKYGQAGPIFHIPTLCRWDNPYRIAALDEWGMMKILGGDLAYRSYAMAEEVALSRAKTHPDWVYFVVDLTSIGPTYHPRTLGQS